FIQDRLGLSGDHYKLSFADFIDLICDQDEAEMDKHWMPQYRMVGPDILQYDFIGRLESFDSDVAKIERDTGLKLTTERHLNRKSAMIGIDGLLTEPIKRKIEKKYEQD